MKYIFILLILFRSVDSSSQSTPTSDSIDIILKPFKKGNKIYREKDSVGKKDIYYNKRNGQIVSIIYQPAERPSAYEYSFVDGELVRMRLFLPYSMNPEAIGKRMLSAYYFRDNILIDKIEMNFPEIDIEYYRALGVRLFEPAIRSVKTKRKRS